LPLSWVETGDDGRSRDWVLRLGKGRERTERKGISPGSKKKLLSNGLSLAEGRGAVTIKWGRGGSDFAGPRGKKRRRPSWCCSGRTGQGE